MAQWPWRRRRAIARAERRLREAPTAEAYLHLARLCLDHGRGERALEVLQAGIQALPAAQGLRTLAEEVSWTEARRRAGVLRARIDSRPRPADVIELSRLFVQVGDLGRALDCLKRGVAQFADQPAVHLEMGRLRLRLWHRDYLAADGEEALRALATVLSLDNSVAEAYRLLAEVYLEIGAGAEALACLEHLAALDGGHLDAQGRQHLEAQAAAARRLERTRAGRDVETLLDLAEVRRRAVVNPAEVPPPGAAERAEPVAQQRSPERDRLLTESEVLACEEGVRAILVEDAGDQPQPLGAFGPEANAETTTVLAEVVAGALRAARRIQIGRLASATVVSPAGGVVVRGFGDEVVACLHDASWSPEGAEARLAGLRAGSAGADSRVSSGA